MPRKSPAEASAGAVREKLGLISEGQLFALLDIEPKTGKNRQSAGTLPPHYKVGRENLYKLTEVEAWIKRHRVARATPSGDRPTP